MAREELEIVIDGDARGAVDASKKASKAMGGLGGTLKKMAIAGGAIFLATKAFQLMGQAMTKVNDFTKESITLAAKQQNAVKKLGTSLETAGIHTEGASERLQEYAASLQLVTTYGDETIIEVEAMLATFGASEDVIISATQATLDMASAMDMDLKAAAILMGKAIAGETGSLSRYGIIVDENELKTRGFAAVLDAVNEKFAGQAASAAETYAGRLEQMKNRFGDLKETIGFAFMPILTDLMGKITESGGLFENLEEWVGKTAKALEEWFSLNWGKIENFFKVIQETDYSAITGGVDDLTTAFGSLIGDDNKGIKGAEKKYQSFVDSLGEGLTNISKVVVTTNALWQTVNGLMVGIIATWDTIWQGVMALETFVDSGFKDTSGFETFHNSMQTLEQVSIMSYDNIAKAWEKQQKLLDDINTEKPQEEMDEMEISFGGNMDLMVLDTIEFQKAIDVLHGVNLHSTHTMTTIERRQIQDLSGYGVSLNKSEQSGGLINSSAFATDLGISLVKGEAVLPASIVRAIKENKTSFAGIDGSGGGGGITNTFNISELVVREYADVERIASELYEMQQTKSRLT